MFASNGKISIRQIKRLMLFNIFGISSLMLPQMLAAESGLDGATAILVEWLWGFCFWLCWIGSWNRWERIITDI